VEWLCSVMPVTSLCSPNTGIMMRRDRAFLLFYYILLHY
jgi:hypothetical protein